MAVREKTSLTKMKCSAIREENVAIKDDRIKDQKTKDSQLQNSSAPTQERKKTAAAAAAASVNGGSQKSHSLCSSRESTMSLGEDSSMSRSKRSSVSMEKAEIEPRRQVIDQAAVYVHKKFGHSKKFSQGDKNELIREMAIKFEADRIQYRQDLEDVEQKLSSEKSALQNRDKILSEIADSLLKFHRKHECRLTTHAHGKESTTQFMLNMAELDAKSIAGVELFQKYLEEFLVRLDVISYVSETLQKERETSFKFLEVEGETKNHKLDEVIASKLANGLETNPQQNLDEVINQLQSEVKSLEATVDRQRTEMEEYKKKMEKADQTIGELQMLVKPTKVTTKPQLRAMFA